MAEGEELESNILQVGQRSPANCREPSAVRAINGTDPVANPGARPPIPNPAPCWEAVPVKPATRSEARPPGHAHFPATPTGARPERAEQPHLRRAGRPGPQAAPSPEHPTCSARASPALPRQERPLRRVKPPLPSTTRRAAQPHFCPRRACAHQAALSPSTRRPACSVHSPSARHAPSTWPRLRFAGRERSCRLLVKTAAGSGGLSRPLANPERGRDTPGSRGRRKCLDCRSRTREAPAPPRLGEPRGIGHDLGQFQINVWKA
jgi:hypothetical protein